MRLMTRRQTAWVRLSGYASWFLDEDHEYRAPILAVWAVTVLLIGGAAFLWFNTPWSTVAQTGLSLLTAAIIVALAAVATFIMQEEMS